MTYDITYKCTKGEFYAQDCTKIPNESELKEIAENLHDVGLGKLKTVEIEIK